MRDALKLIAIYRELRQTIDPDVGAGSLLACAASLIDLFGEEIDGPHFDLRLGGQSFEMLGLDVAIADGGWKVLCRQWPEMGGSDDELCVCSDPLRRWDFQ